MTDLKKNNPPILAYFFVGFLVACFITTTTTIFLRHNQMTQPVQSRLDYLNGKVVAAFEKKFDEYLLIRKTASGLWGAVRYGLFKTGGLDVVIGQNDWLYTAEEFKINKDGVKAEQRMINIIRNVNQFLNDRDIHLVVAVIPAKARIYADYLGSKKMPDAHIQRYSNFLKTLNQMNILAPDLANSFLENKDPIPLYLRLDTHWTPEGAQLAANQIAKAVEHINLPHTQFKTEKISTQLTTGDLEKYIETGFFHDWLAPHADTYNVYKTTAETDSESNSVGNLFDDVKIPVALVGTSYSTIEKWHFEGALKTALQTDVLNLATEGKGPMAPMAEFLKTTDFKTTPLKMVIWEIPERFITVSYPDVTFPEFIMDLH